MDPTPALDLLMGAYFHQDWVDDGGDEWAVIDQFVAGEPAAADLLPREIDLVLSELATERELKAYVLHTLGGSYLAEWNGGTYRGWLTQIADHVRRATD